MKTPTKFSILKFAATALVAICCAPPASAGLINNVLRPDGYGKVGVNMVYNGVSKTVITATNGLPLSLRSGAYVKQPFAAIGIVVSNTYKSYVPLPEGFPAGNYYQVKASGSLFTIDYNLTDGATADNDEFERRLPIDPAECVTGNLQASLEIIGATTGRIVLSGTQSAGSGIWLRLYEYDETAPGNPPVPEDDPATLDIDEGLEFIKAHGTLKSDLATSGPSDFTTDCNAVKIPITFQKKESLYLIVDTIAKSLPLVLNCPSDVVVECGKPIDYGTVTFAGCGNILISYNPPRGTALPLGINPVTVTATDTHGNTKSCTFNVTVVDTKAPTITAPTNVVVAADLGQCSTARGNVNLGTPVTADECGVTGVANNAPATFPKGITTVTWTVTDGAGLQATATQTVTVIDTQKPTITAPANVTSTFCDGTGVVLGTPTTADNCGVASVVNNAPATFPTGLTTVTWTVTDTSGNKATATQTVTVTGLSFQGFYSPVGTANNTVATAVVRNAGASFPLKWSILCGTTYIIGGTPPIVSIVEVNASGTPIGSSTDLPAEYQNDWHINWPTSATAKNKYYKAIVNLADGSKPYVIVKFK